MTTINGIPVSQGKAIGQIHIISVEYLSYEKVSIPKDSIDFEKQKFQEALTQTRETIESLLQITRNQNQQEQIEILEAYHIMLLDPILISEIEQYIEKELVAVENAVTVIFDSYVQK